MDLRERGSRYLGGDEREGPACGVMMWSKRGPVLYHGEEVRGRKASQSTDRFLDDRTVEIGMEICPGSARKSDAESRGHIPPGHMSHDEWKYILA